MASINISIKNDAYRFLKSRKTNDKSFSDVILEFKEQEEEMKGSKEKVMKFLGVLKHINWSAREKRMKEFRREFEGRVS